MADGDVFVRPVGESWLLTVEGLKGVEATYETRRRRFRPQSGQLEQLVRASFSTLMPNADRLSERVDGWRIGGDLPNTGGCPPVARGHVAAGPPAHQGPWEPEGEPEDNFFVRRDTH